MKGILFTLFALLCVIDTRAQISVVGYDGTEAALPAGCNQAVVVGDIEGSECSVYLVSCDDVQRIDGTVGYNGVAPKGKKREGDGRSPEGIYPLRRGLCYTKDFNTQFPMEQYTEEYMWCEDPESDCYNTLIRKPDPAMNGDRLWERRETQFRYIVVVEYNTDPVIRDAGSAIFIHAWRAEGKPTAGCIGMKESDVKRVVEWLNPAQNPHIAILNNDFKIKEFKRNINN